MTSTGTTPRTPVHPIPAPSAAGPSAATRAVDALRGEVLRPGEPGYDEARRGWNGAVDRYPALVVRCRDTEDVVAGVRFAARHDLLLAVRGGGHSVPGWSTCDGGLLLDLSPMQQVAVDPAVRLARVQPGVRWRELDAAAWQHGLATTGGEISDTGVAGLTLGGGIGWLSRRQGHACDALVGARLVLASGDVVEVDEEHHPDLLWGLRGGGGNLGVVTEFRLRPSPTPTPWVRQQLHPADAAPEVLRAWRDALEAAPDAVSGVVALITAPPLPELPDALRGRPAVAITVASFAGPAEDLLAGLPAAPVDVAGPVPYPDLQRSVDASAPWGVPAYCRSDFLGLLDDAALDALAAGAWDSPSPLSHVLVRRLGGAAARVDPTATAFAHRDAEHMLTVAGLWQPGTDGDTERAWTRATWAALRPWARGAYSNHLDGDEGSGRVAEAYPAATRARLAALKRDVDPHNLFRLNVNVPPAA